MADFVEWFEGTGAADGLQGDEDDLIRELESLPSLQRDAVLFLVDCSASMFRRIGDDEARTPPAAGTPPRHTSPFSRAVQCALSFYQEKVITSDKDLVALVLYNTRRKLNLYEFQGVYVFHEFDHPGAARVQELEVLERAGSGDAGVHAEYLEHIGHGLPHTTLLSEALWASQHMFHNLRNRSIGYRRVFLFTDNDDPCAGLPMERERCFARMKDLHDAGVALEVFAHGVDVVSSIAGGASTAPSAPTPPHSGGTASSHISPPLASSADHRPVESSGGVSASIRSTPLAVRGPVDVKGSVHGGSVPLPAEAQEHFIRTKFWAPLITAPMASSGVTANNSGSGGATASFDLTPTDDEYCGTVHVSAAHRSFDAMVSDVKIRTHPQRSAGSCELRVAFGPDAPKALVNIYIPILKCPKPRFKWLDGSTNTAVTSETRLLSKATGAPVAPSELRFSTVVGGEEVTFTKEEKARMKEACASGGVGLTVLGFKKLEDAIRFKYNVSRSAFLHCTAQRGGGASALKFFVQLHRSLTAQGKVGIAEFVSRAGVAPRIVALVPSNIVPNDAAAATYGADSVRGMGFHLVHIPYADDIRSFQPSKQPDVARPTDDQVTKAKRVIRKLQVDYDVTAIANPALQRQYKILQQLALIDPAQIKIDDLTLPDEEGMRRVAPVMADFSNLVFSPGYSADAICPLPKPAKKPPTAAELSVINFDDLEQKGKLDSLTMPFLQQYLKFMKEDTQGAKLKHELVARVAEVVRKRRSVKREREE